MCEAGKFLKNKKEFYRKRKECPNTDVALIIMDRGKTFQICHKCWGKISKSNLEW